MSEAHPRSSVLVISVFVAVASSVTTTATTPTLKTSTEGVECKWNRTDAIQDQTDQNCYLFISEGMTFHQANASCVEEGAHLVSIGNKNENALVVKLKQMAEVWIGLYRLTNESCAGSACTSWMWLDGSDPGYSNWRNGRINSTSQCVFMNTAGTWEHTTLCTSNLGFVCEKRIPSTTTPEPTTIAVTSEINDFSVSNSASPGVPDKGSTIDRTDTDHFSIFMGVGVFVGVFTIAIIIGAVVCLMKRRQGRIVKTSKATADRDASTDMGNYENVDMSVSSKSLVLSQQATPEGMYVNYIITDSTVSTRNHEHATTYRTAYEEVTNYAAISPEYTALRFTDSTNTNENS